jgi:hypothetical protein
MGFAAGFQVGASAVERGLKMREEDKLKRDLAAAYAKPETSQGYTAETGQQLEALANTGAYDIVPQYGPAGEGQAQGAFTGYQAVPKAGLDLQGDMPAAPMAFNPQQVQDYGGRRVAGQFDPAQLRGLQMREAARVLGASGDVRGAAALEMQAEDFAARAADREYQAKERPLRLQSLEGTIAGQKTQQRLADVGLTKAERDLQQTLSFDSAFAKINETKYEKPEDRDAAVLAAVEQFKGPEAKAALQKDYSALERDKIAKDGLKFDQTIKQARLKGPAAALKAIDDLNDSFKLEIDGFNVTQVNNDGSRVPFLSAKTAEEFALGVDSRIKEGGAFELAKFRQDEQTKTAQIGYYNALAKKAASEGGAAANQLSGVQVGYARDPKTGQPVQIMSALRFNKRTGDLESVQVPLEQNVVPAAALDPKKISEAAELMVGTPVDPTNKKGPQHTFQTARQAVTDQIFNQYLGTGGTGGAAADLDPKGLAAKILAGQKPAAATPAASAPVGLSLGQQSPNAATTARDARFNENAQAGLVMREREQRAANDPDIKALRVQLANMRSGDPRRTAELTKQLTDLRQQRYGF